MLPNGKEPAASTGRARTPNWLSQALIAELFQKDVRTVNEHLQSIYEEGEIELRATIRTFRIVRREGSREVEREIEHYNLDAILAVGYRVRSARGTQFRQWATKHLSFRRATIPAEMCCPFFSPRQRRAAGGSDASALLPLGDAWTGVCLAQPGNAAEPGDARLSLCNLGYARGICERFPAATAADAVRFAIASDDGHSLEIHFAMERGHHPRDHGRIVYRIAEGTFEPPLQEAAFASQARACAASYLRRKSDAAGSG